MKAGRSTEIGRKLLYLVSAIPLGALAFTVLVAGWTLTLSISFTPLVVPALAGLRAIERDVKRLTNAS